MKFVNEEINKNLTGIYRIVNIKTNQEYIGQTRERFERRYLHHRWKLRNGNHDNINLQESWNYYGEDKFIFEVIEKINKDESTEYFNNREEFYIKNSKENNLSFNILDNNTWRGLHLPEETKRKIGEKNKVNMTGKKHSEETKKRMSEARKGHAYLRYKKTCTVNDELAFKIKTMLVSGIKPKQVSIDLNIPYHNVNGILSNGNWSNIKVDGWEEYQNSRKKYSKFKEGEKEEIYKLYTQGIKTKEELSLMFNKHIRTISDVIREIERNKTA